jgi:hypothetical protein
MSKIEGRFQLDRSTIQEGYQSRISPHCEFKRMEELARTLILSNQISSEGRPTILRGLGNLGRQILTDLENAKTEPNDQSPLLASEYQRLAINAPEVARQIYDSLQAVRGKRSSNQIRNYLGLPPVEPTE